MHTHMYTVEPSDIIKCNVPIQTSYPIVCLQKLMPQTRNEWNYFMHSIVTYVDFLTQETIYP